MEQFLKSTTKLRLVLAAFLTIISIYGFSLIQFNADLDSAIARPSLNDGSEAISRVDEWQDAPVVLFFEWRESASNEMLSALSSLSFELQFEDGVQEVITAFSLLDEDGQNPLEAALMGSRNAGDAISELRSNVLFGEQFFSADHRSTVLLVRGSDHLLGDLADRYHRCAQAEAFCLTPIGSVAIERSIQDRLRQDNRVIPIVSLVVSLSVLTLWFQSFVLALRLVFPPTIGLIWYFGFLGLSGTPLDPFNSIVPTVILTLGLADMLHLRRARELVPKTKSKNCADRALQRVFPAITITTLTTMLAFATLALEGAEALTRLAFSGVIGVFLLWLSIVLLGPAAFWRCAATRSRRALSRRITSAVFFSAKSLSATALQKAILVAATIAGFIAVHASLGVDFEFDENLPKSELSAAVDRAGEAGLALAPYFIEVPAADLSRQREMVDQLYGGKVPNAEFFQQARSAEGSLMAPFSLTIGTSANELLNEIELKQEAMGSQPLFATGYPVVVSNAILSSIKRLELLVVASFLFQSFLILLITRSLRAGGLAFVVNLIPILGVYLALYFAVGWMNVSAAVTLIVATGIVVDDTVHFVLASRNKAGKLRPERGLIKTGEPLTLTSLVLCLGFGVMTLSGLPGLQLFGVLMVFAIILAWAADVFLLTMLMKRS